MKNQMVFLFLFLILFLAGCSEDPESFKETNKEELKEVDEIEREVVPLLLDGTAYSQTVGFLSDYEVVYITREEEQSFIFRYNLYTGEKELLNKLNDTVIQASFHPSKKFILLHCSNDSEEADLKVMNLEGEIIHNVSIASKEIYIDWHPENPDLLFISAFDENFEFLSYVYDGKEENLTIVNVLSPFNVWLDENVLLYADGEEALSNEQKLIEFNWRTGEQYSLTEEGVVFAKARSANQLFVKVKSPSDTFSYVYKQDNEELYTVEAPALSNYSEWYVPEIQFGKEGIFYTLVAEEGAVLDTYKGSFQLKRFDGAANDTLLTLPRYTTFEVSPNEQWILYGYDMSNIANSKSKEQIKWLQLQ